MNTQTAPKTRLNYHTNYETKRFIAKREPVGKDVPRGECVYLMLTEQGVKRCGAKCEGQRCADHPQGVRVHFNIGGKGGAAL